MKQKDLIKILKRFPKDAIIYIGNEKNFTKAENIVASQDSLQQWIIKIIGNQNTIDKN